MHLYLYSFEHPLTGDPAGITTYAALLFLGVACAIGVSVLLGMRRGLASFDVFAAMLLAFATGLVGARVLYLIIHGGEVISRGGWQSLFVSGGGLIWYGGALAGLATFALYCRGYGLPVARMLDVGSVGAATGQAFGRIGCFTAGCCHGKPAPDGLPAVMFPTESLAPSGIGLHPVQLYEAALLFLLAVFLSLAIILRRSWPNGFIALFYVSGYAVLRFFTEMLRGDHRGPELAGLSVSQTISLALLVAALLAWVGLSCRKSAIS